MGKLQNIQALRGVAVLLVVAYHLSLIEQKYGGSKTIISDQFGFGIFGVDLFFVISGFIMATITRGKFGIKKYAVKFIFNRATRIYPTYWFYTILALIIYLINPMWVNSSQGNQVDIFTSFFLLPSSTLPLVLVGWTLIHEIYFYLIFFLILLLSPEKKMPAVILLWGIGILLFAIFFKPHNPFTKVAFHPLTLEFIGGCFLSILFHKKKWEMNLQIVIIFTFSILLASLYGFNVYQNYTGQSELTGFWRIIILGLPGLITVYCLINVEQHGYVANSVLIKIGDASYSIYLSHIFTLSAIGRMWSIFSNDDVYDNIIVIPILFIIVVIVGIMSYNLIEKPLLKLSRRIS